MNFPGIDLLLKSISPAKGFSLLKMHLETDAKLKVEKYNVLMDVVKEEILITIFHESYSGGEKTKPLKDGAKFIKMALHYMGDKLPKGAEIHKVMVMYTPEEITGTLFFADNGEKKSLSHKF